MIENTKRYARESGTSLSRLAEDYFSMLSRDNQDDLNLSGTVAEMDEAIKQVRSNEV